MNRNQLAGWKQLLSVWHVKGKFKDFLWCKVICTFVSRMFFSTHSALFLSQRLLWTRVRWCRGWFCNLSVHAAEQAPCGLALAYCRVTLLVFYKEEGTCRWRGRRTNQEAKASTFTSVASFLFSDKDSATASYIYDGYIYGIISLMEGYSVLQGDKGYV